MRLTRYTDYAMRVLLYLGARQDRLCSIAEIAGAYGISQTHLMKVVSDLAGAGYLVSVRGRSGMARWSWSAMSPIIGASAFRRAARRGSPCPVRSSGRASLALNLSPARLMVRRACFVLSAAQRRRSLPRLPPEKAAI